MKNENPMRVKPVLPLLLSMAFPPMISMLIQSLYNIVDSVFVSYLGENALTAVSLVFPLQNLALSCAVGIGVALNALIARHLGEKDDEKASFVAGQGVMLSALTSTIFVVIGLFFIKPFLSLFTTQGEVLTYGIQYGFIVITFAFGMFIHIAIEKTFQATGNMIIPMLLQLTGAIINIVLDPILIFGLFGLPSLGVIGAALATVFGQFGACTLAIIIFKKKSHHIHINLKHFRFDLKTVKNLVSIAIPSGIMMCMPSLLVTSINGILSSISQTAVAFFGIYFKLQTFIYMPCAGITQGMRPIMSYNYGAKQADRMQQTLKYSFLVIASILCIGTLSFHFLPTFILSMFNATPAMLEIGIPALKILSLSFILSAFALVMAGVLESLGKGKFSLIISLLRQFVIIVTLSPILLKFIGINGIWLTFPLSEFIASCVAFIIYQKQFKTTIKSIQNDFAM